MTPSASAFASAFAFSPTLHKQNCVLSSRPWRTNRAFSLPSQVGLSEPEQEEDELMEESESTTTSVSPSTLSHAMEVFDQFATGGTADDDDVEDSDAKAISKSSDLLNILCSLDVEASQEEADVLFRYLDEDGDGRLDFEDFLPWYLDAAEAAYSVAESFQSLLVGRRTIEAFDQTPVSNDVLYRAVQCAIAAPNRSCSEPWRFIQVGSETVQAFSKLNQKIRKTMETTDGTSSILDWTQVPGWCVVTTKVSPGNTNVEQEDFKSVCCAIQNFMLSMWSEGVGTKWTSGPVQKTQEFADLCGVDTGVERVVGCIWYGYATGGAKYADPRRRKKNVEDVLTQLP